MGNSTGSIADNRLLPLADLALPRLLVPSKAVLSFVRTKIWVVPSKGAPGFISGPADPHWASAGVVQFRHSGATGDKQLIVNGQLISKSCDLLDGGDNIPFLIGDISCRVEVLAFPGLTGPQVCVRQAVMQHAAGGSCSAASRGGGSASASDNRTVLYEVVSQLAGREFAALRRFAEFDELDALVRSAFKGHHLYANVPPLPRKRNKLLTDHYTLDFIEQRRCDLDAYLKCLVAIPHTSKNPDIIGFLGIRVEAAPQQSASF
eukprot:TRINITY_DN645_c0_g1_i3.p1 TRINITY_DN645_c0_g1~~TRINITY_DN645_c0_g1_i3.p1  ORF type:complete len:262 (-),score=75.10 TRINITY_DN645_c0_g1_i3:536-1321(-)